MINKDLIINNLSTRLLDVLMPADIYSVSGALVRSQADSLDGLPQGIYIVGGKKVVVR
jgi:hypothetical protein